MFNNSARVLCDSIGMQIPFDGVRCVRRWVHGPRRAHAAGRCVVEQRRRDTLSAFNFLSIREASCRNRWRWSCRHHTASHAWSSISIAVTGQRQHPASCIFNFKANKNRNWNQISSARANSSSSSADPGDWKIAVVTHATSFSEETESISLHCNSGFVRPYVWRSSGSSTGIHMKRAQWSIYSVSKYK